MGLSCSFFFCVRRTVCIRILHTPSEENVVVVKNVCNEEVENGVYGSGVCDTNHLTVR